MGSGLDKFKNEMKKESSSLLPRISVNRPVSVVMGLMALLVVGYIAYSRIPLSRFPEGLEDNWLYINIYYPHASPFEVKEKILPYAEDELSKLNWVKYLETVCAYGQLNAKLQCRPNTDTNRAYVELQDVLDRIRPDLPERIESMHVVQFDMDDASVMGMTATFEGDFINPYYLLNTYLRPMLQRIEGVAHVGIWGPGRKEVRIELDEDKVLNHKIQIADLVDHLQTQNFTLSGGYVREGGKKILVRSVGRFYSIEELKNMVVDAHYDLRLKDIAEISLKLPKRKWVNRVDRKESMWISVQRTSTGNIVAVSEEVRATLEEVKKRPDFQGVEIDIVWDQGRHIVRSLDHLKSSGWWGGLFAAAILFIFLRILRITLVITSAIPLSILTTMIAIYFMGWSLNSATMLGLLLSLGLVVDNAIVIVENIYRRRQEGTDPRLASIRGAGEVELAVTTATLTTIVVFLPLILMSEDEHFVFWMMRIGLPVAIGLLASLFIALILIPLAVQHLEVSRKRGDPRWIMWLRNGYLRCLRWVLNHRLDSLIAVLVIMGSIYIPYEGLKDMDRPEGRRRHVHLRFNMPTGNTLEQSDKFMRSVEDTLMNHQKEYGFEHLRVRARTWDGHVRLVFKEEEQVAWYKGVFDQFIRMIGLHEKSHMTPDEIIEDIKERLVMPAGVHLVLNWGRSGSSFEAADEHNSVSIHLYGDDYARLVRLAEEVERRMDQIPGFISVYTDMDRGTPELQVNVHGEKLSRYGISPEVISNSLLGRLAGFDVGDLPQEDGSELDIRIQVEEEDHYNLQQLRNLPFSTNEGLLVPLEILASFQPERSLGKIRRKDRKTLIRVTALAPRDNARELFGEVDRMMEDFQMPRGYRWDKGASFVRLEEANRSRQFALIMAGAFVFLLMGVLFESILLPFSVMIAVPFALLGVYWMLYLTHTPFEFLSQIGTVILIGMVVNNAIVLIDLANRLRRDGLNCHDALIEAARHRFRPILMTTFTTICGLIPMTVGNVQVIGTGYAPLGRAMMGGLLASALLTLLIVPLCYSLLEILRGLVKDFVVSAFGNHHEPR